MENDKAFDNFIRQELENHPLSENSGDWAKMESQILADEQLQDDTFDDFVRDGVESTNPQLPVSNWALMESMILSEQIFSSEVFDEQILEDVHQTNLQSPQGNWGMMESMLVADELILNQEFDSSIKEDLQNIDTNIPGNWDRMESLLENDDQHGRELLYAKTIELALIVLAVVMLFRFFPDMDGFSQVEFPTGETANLEEHISNTNKQDKNIIRNNDMTIIETSDVSDKSIATNNNVIIKENKTDIILENKSIYSLSNSNNRKNIGESDLSKNHNNTSIENSNLTQNSNSELSNNNVLVKNIDDHINILVPKSLTNDNVILEENVNNLPLITLEELVAVSMKKVYSDKENGKKSIHTKTTPKFRIGIHISADRNHVMSPYDKETEISYEQNTYGLSFGAEASIVKHNMEFSSGISYTRMKYLPKTVLEITGNTARGYEADKLDLMSYHIVSVPLSMRYYFSKYASWRFYAKTGITMNTTLVHTNQINQYTLPSFRDLDALLEKGPESIRMEKQGVLNGKSFGDNFFLKANLSVGVERSFAKRYHVFVEPAFNYHIYSLGKGFGPNKDRINHVSLNMGVRMGF